jgi:hypothetical protein
MNIFAKRPSAAAPAPTPRYSDGHMKADPRYIAAVQQRTQLGDALSAVLGQRREKELIRLSLKSAKAPTAADHVADAMQLAASGEVVSRQSSDLAQLRLEDHALAQQEQALRAAINLDPVTQVERALNAEYARSVAIEHREIMRDHADALRAYNDAAMRERALLARGAALGFDEVALPDRAAWPHLGTLDDSNSAIAIHLHNLRLYTRA